MAHENLRTLLMVLDGFGIGKDSPFNAIKNAKMPFYRELTQKYPMSELITHGKAVGLPDGVMGNSEVGHMTLGSGRIIYQELVRISKAINDGSFFDNQVLKSTLQKALDQGGKVHLMGLLSDGGVHSHIDHLFGLLDLCLKMNVPKVSVHAFLDGRDTPPDSSIHYVKQLLRHPAFQKNATLATIMGRYWAMDRDKRWERTQKAYEGLCGKIPAFESKAKIPALDAIEKSHQNQVMDEFVEPVLLDPKGALQEKDAVIFFNFRADRARQLTQTLREGSLAKLSAQACMTEYDAKFDVPVAFEKQKLTHIFGEILEQEKLHQFRIAETEKYAHVTFFFNGGREKPFVGEERHMVESPKDVPTYDLKPEMSAFEVARLASKRITQKKDQFILMNFANADMVGHTGKYEAAVQAMEALDQCLSQVIGAAEKNDFHVLLTADHGNAEQMQHSDGKPHTQHTLNPVPAIWVPPNTANAPRSDRKALNDGTLADVMPTLMEIMHLNPPKEVTGKSLLPKS